MNTPLVESSFVPMSRPSGQSGNNRPAQGPTVQTPQTFSNGQLVPNTPFRQQNGASVQRNMPVQQKGSVVQNGQVGGGQVTQQNQQTGQVVTNTPMQQRNRPIVRNGQIAGNMHQQNGQVAEHGLSNLVSHHF